MVCKIFEQPDSVCALTFHGW